jgi:hypothetical protein
MVSGNPDHLKEVTGLRNFQDEIVLKPSFHGLSY